MKVLILSYLLAAVFVNAQFTLPTDFDGGPFHVDPFHDMTLDECVIMCEINTCEENGDQTKSSDQMLSCTNACYMRHIGVSKNECLRHCDRHGQSGCYLVVNEVTFNMCFSRDVRGPSCGSVSLSDCELGCESYPEAPEIGDQCVKHADLGPFGMEVGSCCGLPGEITCGPGYTAKPPAIDVCGGSCPENWCNHDGALKNVREYSCEPSEFVQVYGEGSCETLMGYKTIMDTETCELAAKFLEKQFTTVSVNEFVPDNRPVGCTYHEDEHLQLWTESRGGCTYGDGCLCEVTENLIGDKCIKHADRGPLEMEIGSCCGRPGKITCGPGYVLQAPFPDVCGGSCPENWCNHDGVLSETRSFSCVPEQPEPQTPNTDSADSFDFVVLSSTGSCSENAHLTEQECQNLDNGGSFANWAGAGTWNLPETCGCYIDQDGSRYFNRLTGACNLADIGEKMICKDQKAPSANNVVANNVVEENASRVGGWGGSCTCPDGSLYQVGDNYDACGSLACIGGVSGTCNRFHGPWAYRKVTCGAATEASAAPTLTPTSSPSFMPTLNPTIEPTVNPTIPTARCKNFGQEVDGVCECTPNYTGATCETRRTYEGWQWYVMWTEGETCADKGYLPIRNLRECQDAARELYNWNLVQMARTEFDSEDFPGCWTEPGVGSVDATNFFTAAAGVNEWDLTKKLVCKHLKDEVAPPQIKSRLVDGTTGQPSEATGLLQVWDLHWNYFIADTTEQDVEAVANLACMEMGYSRVMSVRGNQWTPNKFQDMVDGLLIMDFECLGSETSLSQCNYEKRDSLPNTAIEVTCTNEAPTNIDETCSTCRVRRNWNGLSEDEKRTYIDTVNTARREEPYKSQYDALVMSHGNLDSGVIHGREQFLAWHRWFIYEYENLLRQITPCITVPYWAWEVAGSDWHLDEMWGPEDYQFGTCMHGHWRDAPFSVNDGPFSDMILPGTDLPLSRDCWLPNSGGRIPKLSDLDFLETSSDDFLSFFQGINGVHGTVHVTIGGTMGSIRTSGMAPEFFLHHNNVDRIWAQWQLKSASHELAQSSRDAILLGTDPKLLITDQPYTVDDFTRPRSQAEICVEYEDHAADISGRRQLSARTTKVNLAVAISNRLPKDVTFRSLLVHTNELSIQMSEDFEAKRLMFAAEQKGNSLSDERAHEIAHEHQENSSWGKYIKERKVDTEYKPDSEAKAFFADIVGVTAESVRHALEVTHKFKRLQAFDRQWEELEQLFSEN